MLPTVKPVSLSFILKKNAFHRKAFAWITANSENNSPDIVSLYCEKMKRMEMIGFLCTLKCINSTSKT